MSDIKKLTQLVIKFRDERDWKQFHGPKDLAIGLMLEVGELAEHFQWKNRQEIKTYLKKHKNDVAEEVADVLYWILIISHDLKIDLKKSFEQKMIKNTKKYPVSKSKGKHTKYTEL